MDNFKTVFVQNCWLLESGIKVDKLSKMDFRRKSGNNLASNFMQIAIDNEGNEGIPQSNHELPFHLWHYHYFKQNSCNFCDDVFGEVADVTFMDAWLPEYDKDYKGTSLIIVRTPKTLKFLENLKECKLKPIHVNKIIKSQMGVIQEKKILIKGRLYKSEKSGSFYPKKRVNPDVNIYTENKKFINLTTEIQSLSKEIWPKYRLNESTSEFWKDLTDYESKIRKYQRESRMNFLLKTPTRLFKRILGV